MKIEVNNSASEQNWVLDIFCNVELWGLKIEVNNSASEQSRAIVLQSISTLSCYHKPHMTQTFNL